MLTFSPKSISLHEADPLSVASYNVEVRGEDRVTVIGEINQDADPSGDTVVSLAAVVNASLAGQPISLFVREIGPTGAASEFFPAGDAAGHGVFNVTEVPDGPEGIVVNL